MSTPASTEPCRSGPNGFQLTKQEIFSRFTNPVGQVTFWAFFLVGVIGFGGWGVWYEVFDYLTASEDKINDLIISFITFFPATSGAAFVQMYLAADEKYWKSSVMLLGVPFFIMTCLLTYLRINYHLLSLVLAILTSVLALALWWIANGSDPAFSDGIRQDASVGGNINTPLQGNLSGFKQ
ncbi:hypothetical protein [Gluconobacter oxydans]|uniref:hypothetical protein n=1 Tax=Gluconobacter oxydans TaxID=442 RepID=UPI0039EC1292